jgi:hypothetical protein
MTYCILIINEVVDIHHLKLHHLTPPHSSSLLLTPPHSSSLLLTPPHSSSLLLTPPHSSSSKIRIDRPLYYYFAIIFPSENTKNAHYPVAKCSLPS